MNMAAPVDQKLNKSVLGLDKINRTKESKTRSRSGNRSFLFLPRETGVAQNIPELDSY